MLEGPVIKSILTLSIPLFISNLLQQLYNIADTIIVGRFIGADALAAVGSSFTFMIFINSIIYGLALGSGSVFSIKFGKKDYKGFKNSLYASFFLIFSTTIILNLLAYLFIDQIIYFMKVPSEIFTLMKEYLLIIFAGFLATSLYNFIASIYRSLGDSKTPMIFLAISVVINIILDYIFVKILSLGISGAAVAKPIMSIVLTVLSLGTRVLLAFLLAPIPHIGTNGIWWAIVIGWFLADTFGLVYYLKIRK